MKLKRFILRKNSNFSVVWLPNLKNFKYAAFTAPNYYRLLYTL